MTGNVVSMSGDPIPVGEPDPELIAEIEYLLDQAKSGQIITATWAALHSDGSTARGFCGGWFSMSLVGQMVALQNDVLRQMPD